MTTAMPTSYCGDPALKERLVSLQKKRADDDLLMQRRWGHFGDNHSRNPADFKGCTIACCAVDIATEEELRLWKPGSGWSMDVLEKRGFPRWFQVLCLDIFDSMGADNARRFAAEWPEAVPVGLTEQQWNNLEIRFHSWLYCDSKNRVTPEAQGQKLLELLREAGQ